MSNVFKLNGVCFYLIMLSVLLLTSNSASADEFCLYDPNYITRQYVIENTGFSNVVWNDDENEALIDLSNGEKVILEYWACEQFGLTAVYQMPRTPDTLEKDYIIGKMIWLGDRVLDDKYRALLNEALKNKEFLVKLDSVKSGKGAFIAVETGSYDSFFMSVDNDDAQSHFTISITWLI